LARFLEQQPDVDLPINSKRAAGRHWLTGVASVAAIFVGGVAFLGVEPAAPRIDARTLLIDRAEFGDLTVAVRGPGVLVPEKIRWITTLTAGRVEQRLVDPGQNVDADSIIVELSNPDVELESLDARRALTAARAALLALSTRLEEERLNQLAVVASARAGLSEAQRLERASEGLVGKDLISAIEAGRREDRAVEMNTRFQAELQRERLYASTAEQKISLQQTQVARLEEIADFHQARVDSMTVLAGASGILQHTELEVGQWVQPGELLAKVAEPGRLKAVLDIPETLARDVALGQPVAVDTRNGVAHGRVSRIDPSVRDGSVVVHVRINGDLPKGARPDLSIEGTIETTRLEGVLHVDRPAFSQAESTLSLFKLSPDGRAAVRVSVKLGRVAANDAEIAHGLLQGDRVIVSDMSRWAAFDRVDIAEND
jgi:HlyD family secretion protein